MTSSRATQEYNKQHRDTEGLLLSGFGTSLGTMRPYKPATKGQNAPQSFPSY